MISKKFLNLLFFMGFFGLICSCGNTLFSNNSADVDLNADDNQADGSDTIGTIDDLKLKAEIKNNEILLTWESPSKDYKGGYCLFRSFNSEPFELFALLGSGTMKYNDWIFLLAWSL